MHRAFRVLKRFQWGGWEHAPNLGACGCGCERCTGEIGSGCHCRETICRCACGIPANRYAGDIWVVQEGHPRLDVMIFNRFAIPDASLPPVEELLKAERFLRLLSPPTEAKGLVGAARRGPGKPAAPR